MLTEEAQPHIFATPYLSSNRTRQLRKTDEDVECRIPLDIINTSISDSAIRSIFAARSTQLRNFSPPV